MKNVRGRALRSSETLRVPGKYQQRLKKHKNKTCLHVKQEKRSLCGINLRRLSVRRCSSIALVQEIEGALSTKYRTITDELRNHIPRYISKLRLGYLISLVQIKRCLMDFNRVESSFLIRGFSVCLKVSNCSSTFVCIRRPRPTSWRAGMAQW